MSRPHVNPRDRATGRFKHVWDYVGVIEGTGGVWAEVGRCDLPTCGRYRLSGNGADRVMTRAQFERRFPEEAKIM